MCRILPAALAFAGAAILASGAADAAPITYDIDVTFSASSTQSATLTGTLTADMSGPLSLSDITAQNLTLTGNGGSSSVRFDFVTGSSNNSGLNATPDSLVFKFDGGSGFADIAGGFLGGSVLFQAGADPNDGIPTPSIAVIAPSNGSGVQFDSFTQDQAFGSSVTLGTVLGSGTQPGSVSTVPLPASAPLFGAALVALGAAGYGLKRMNKAAAQA